MAETTLWIIGSAVLVSVLSLIGVITLTIRDKLLKRVLFILVGFSAGTLMGGAFLHLLPEALRETGSSVVFLYVLVGFALFFLIERVLHWHHCHKGDCDVHTFTYMNLIGDSIHNFIDGVIIAASYLINIPFGVITTIAIIAHEIPQEISDFGVLIYGGFGKVKALCFNFLTALASILGAFIGLSMSGSVDGLVRFVVPFAAGGFIYIAASDLVPELHKEPELKKSIWSFGFFIIGILFMWLVKLVFGY